MYLKNNSSCFELKILSYSDSVASLQEDRDWLDVSIHVVDGSLEWQTTGTFLRVPELQIILNKLIEVFQKPTTSVERINLIENELAFSIGPNEISIHLDFYAHPKGKNYDYNEDSEYTISFILDTPILNNLIHGIERDIRRFPRLV
nr:hypothetical protein [uncultured Fluviicola sp.]